MEREINIKKDWKLIEEKLSKTFFEGIDVLKLKINKDQLCFKFTLYKNKVLYLLFLNGYLYTGVEKKQYMNVRTKYMFPLKEREKQKRIYIKEFGKKKGTEEFEKSFWNNKVEIYNLMFTSKLKIKKMLERQNDKIYLIEEGL